MERTQARKRKLKHRRYADLVPQSCPLRYESRRNPCSLAASAAFENKSRLVLASQDYKFASYELFSVSILCSAFTPGEPQASFFSVEDVRLLRELDWDRETYQYAEMHFVEGKDKNSYCKAAATI